MPLTFIDIERQKNWKIGLFFILLLFIYLVITILLLHGLLHIFPITPGGFSLKAMFSGGNYLYFPIIVGFAFIIASTHFYLSTYDTVHSIMKNIGAIPPDKGDEIHKMLMDVMEEIHIVTGNKRRIGCMVIPSMSMNAMSVVDLKGNAAIAITEGLLSRLSRPQLEAVLAHEAYHILSGDCLEGSIATSLFGMYSSIFEKLQDVDEKGPPPLSPTVIVAFVLLKIGILLNMFISREREYRADAGAVRMTRDPLALAEVLFMLSRNWRGSGYIGRGLEMLCIVNPHANELDESEGFMSDLLSTHPPLKKRMETLLRMARVSPSELDKRMIGRRWIMGEVKESKEASRFLCPNCKQSLFVTSYEKTSVYGCNSCGGILLEDDKIPRIIVREGVETDTERIRSLAMTMAKENQRAIAINRLRDKERRNIPLLKCPGCNNTMMRRFYSLAYLVEIDCCNFCRLTWFDRDELEILQCMIENRITAKIEA
ncbi:MAG: hypothetical protein Fur0020_01680 [Thermodesulfovibrionia bacterium]